MVDSSKIFNSFIEKVIKETPYAKEKTIKEIVMKMLEIIQQDEDASNEELIEKTLESIIDKVEQIRKDYQTPGYTVGIKVGNINIKILGGYLDSLKTPMVSDALFDIASMHKMYTQVIAYNLINEKIISFSDKIKELDQRFVNLEDLTIKDVLSFTTEFQTPSPIKEKKTVEEARKCLFQVKVIKKEKYNYNDIGMMIIKEVLENVTGKTYEQLFDKYIKDKLNLKDTYLVLPKEKINRATGSANASRSMANDPSALALGGYSGHAGAFATSDDLIKFGQKIMDGTILPKKMLKDAYTSGIKNSRGLMGNTFTSNKNGIRVSFVDSLEPIGDFVIQGSTRVQMNIGKYSVSTILLNPSSMSIEEAKIEEKKVNKNQLQKGKSKLKLVKTFSFVRQNHIIDYQLIDARLMVPKNLMKALTTEIAKLSLQLRFLNEMMENRNKIIKKEIYIEKIISEK